MHPLTITLCLLATPALADVAGVASVKRAALAAYAGHIMAFLESAVDAWMAARIAARVGS